MSSIRKCTKCGQQISLRKMPHGKWVAFDASTQIAHKCHKKNNPDAKIKDLAKDKVIKEAAEESISIKYEDEPSTAKTSEYVDKNIVEPKKKEEIKENTNVPDDDIKAMSAEELIKYYKSDNAFREERYTPPPQSGNSGDFFKLFLYAGGFFLVMFLLAKAPGALVGLIFFVIFIFFIFKR
jgi:Flp pilus assembly protein TadB